MNIFFKFLIIVLTIGIISGIIFCIISKGDGYEKSFLSLENYPSDFTNALINRFFVFTVIFFIGFSLFGFIFVAPIVFYRTFLLSVEVFVYFSIEPSLKLLYSLILPIILELFALFLISAQAMIFSMKLLHPNQEKLSHRIFTYLITGIISIPFLLLSSLCDIIF